MDGLGVISRMSRLGLRGEVVAALPDTKPSPRPIYRAVFEPEVRTPFPITLPNSAQTSPGDSVAYNGDRAPMASLNQSALYTADPRSDALDRGLTGPVDFAAVKATWFSVQAELEGEDEDALLGTAIDHLTPEQIAERRRLAKPLPDKAVSEPDKNDDAPMPGFDLGHAGAVVGAAVAGRHHHLRGLRKPGQKPRDADKPRPASKPGEPERAGTKRKAGDGEPRPGERPGSERLVGDRPAPGRAAGERLDLPRERIAPTRIAANADDVARGAAGLEHAGTFVRGVAGGARTLWEATRLPRIVGALGLGVAAMAGSVVVSAAIGIIATGLVVGAVVGGVVAYATGNGDKAVKAGLKWAGETVLPTAARDEFAKGNIIKGLDEALGVTAMIDAGKMAVKGVVAFVANPTQGIKNIKDTLTMGVSIGTLIAGLFRSDKTRGAATAVTANYLTGDDNSGASRDLLKGVQGDSTLAPQAVRIAEGLKDGGAFRAVPGADSASTFATVLRPDQPQPVIGGRRTPPPHDYSVLNFGAPYAPAPPNATGGDQRLQYDT